MEHRRRSTRTLLLALSGGGREGEPRHRGQGRAGRIFLGRLGGVGGGQVPAGRSEQGTAPLPHWRRRRGPRRRRRRPGHKAWAAGSGGRGGAMQSCGRWWGRLAARGGPRHLRPAGGGGQHRQQQHNRQQQQQQQRWVGGGGGGGGGDAARCIEQLLPRHDDFSRRHIGPREGEKREMLRALGVQVGVRAAFWGGGGELLLGVSVGSGVC